MPCFALGGIAMAYTNQDVESKAREMLGYSPLAESGRVLRSVCDSAAAELESRLRAGVKSSDIEELFVSAAGVLAISLYLELEYIPDEKIDSFTAGDLSVKLREGTKAQSAATLRKRAESMLSAYLDCGGFEFTGVAG